jgi:hypothetical protein
VRIVNEETVKNSIVVPFFQELGFDISEINYETSFTIRLGRSTILVDGQKDRASGRLDILFKKGNENLFIVETKPQTQTLSEQDKQQAISYARLLEHIAPFAVVTNGTRTEIYDTITGEDLSGKPLEDSNYGRKGYVISLDPELRYRALKNFIGISFENLKIFCKKQLDLNMKNLKADGKNLQRKFIPEIYLRRKSIGETFSNFLKSESKIFSIIGESGFGKTNTIGDLALEYSDTYPILFFNGAGILNGILEQIAFEFNWEFEFAKSGIGIVKRMIDILYQYNVDLIIFIDAIDEMPQKDFVLSLDNFVKHLPTNKVKICLTCKESLWHKFLSISGNPSFVSGSLFSKNREKEPYSFKMGLFSDDELEVVIRKYREFYHLPEINGQTKNLCKNPIMLRVISEVYKSKEKIPDRIIEPSIIAAYISKKMEKSKTPEEDLRFLSFFGKRLFDNNRESLYEDEIPETLSIPEYLVSFGMISRTKDELGRHALVFQYDYIRDFIICFHSLKLDELSDEQLVEFVSKKIHENLPRYVFRYFESVSEERKKGILRKEFSKYNFRRAYAFVDHYQKILDAQYNVIRNRFYPYTKANIGLLVFYHLDFYFRPQYGFRKLFEDEDRVIWLEKENWYGETSEKERWQIAQKYGIKKIFSSSHDFTNIDPLEYARNTITGQLKVLIENRLLDESQNIALSIEYILDMMRKYNRTFDLPKFEPDFWNKALPISLEYLSKKIEQMRPQHPLPFDFEELLFRLHIVKRKQQTIEKTLLPFPSDCRVPRISAWFYNKYTKEELINYLNNFFHLLFREYKILVDHNLPFLKEHMYTYNRLPGKVIGELERKNDDFVGLTYCHIPGEEELTIEIIVKGEKSIFDPDLFVVNSSMGKVKINSYNSSHISLFFDSDSGRDNIIQKHVYQLIYDDLKKIFHW